MGQILTLFKTIILCLLKMAKILLFHRKRCENCLYRRKKSLYCIENNKSTTMLGICEKWEKEIVKGD